MIASIAKQCFDFMTPFSRRTLLLAAIAAATSPALLASENTYLKLDVALPNAEGTLTKIFSYDCPFCYRYDKTVDAWLEKEVKKTSNLTFNPVFLEKRAKYGEAAALFLAYCRVKDTTSNVSVTAKESLFSRAKEAMYFGYLKEKKRWEGGETEFLKTLTDATGIAEAEFTKHRNDKAVLAIRDAWLPAKAVADIQGIPAYVVNGRYLVLNKAVRSKSALSEIIAELAKLPIE